MALVNLMLMLTLAMVMTMVVMVTLGMMAGTVAKPGMHQ